MHRKLREGFPEAPHVQYGYEVLHMAVRHCENNALDHKTRADSKSKVIDNTSLDQNIGKTDNVADGQPSPEEYIISTQDHEKFLNCIGGLPDLYREIAGMCYVDNLGYKEISEKTGIPINTIKTRISRARAQIIRKMLEEE